MLRVGISSCLSGCALTLEMMAISGISYIATGKSLSDNAFSLVTNKNCALHRIIINEVICMENEPSTNDPNNKLMLARNETTSTIEPMVTTAKSIIKPAQEITSDVSSVVISALAPVSMSDFAMMIEPPKVKSIEHSSAQTFAVVGSFNNYQYALRRNEKYSNFNPQIIENNTDSTTKYRVVIGPYKHHDFITQLPVMVGAETQLPWEIDLCINDMSPPPCNNIYASNIDEQQSESKNAIEAPIVSTTQMLR